MLGFWFALHATQLPLSEAFCYAWLFELVSECTLIYAVVGLSLLKGYRR